MLSRGEGLSSLTQGYEAGVDLRVASVSGFLFFTISCVTIHRFEREAICPEGGHKWRLGKEMRVPRRDSGQ